jgi:hypothetical protein
VVVAGEVVTAVSTRLQNRSRRMLIPRKRVGKWVFDSQQMKMSLGGKLGD